MRNGYAWVFCPKARTPPEEEKTRIDAFAEKRVKELKKNLPKPRKDYNYATDVYGKWRGARFYLIVVYACPGRNALSPSFEHKLARLECVGDGKYSLYALRHNGDWMPIRFNEGLNACLKELRENPWFTTP